MRSPTINASRYSNGTLVKIQTTGDNFLSVNYDPETSTGTFTPSTIRMTPTYSGGVGFGGWVYRKGPSDSWTAVTSGEHGLTLSNDVLIVSSASDLFETGNDSTVTFRVNGDDGLHWDSLTIMRYVSPLAVYRKSNTQINQTNDKIELIASAEELRQYAVGNTLAKNFASFKQTAEGFEQTVRADYATKVTAQGYADTAQRNAAADATTKANAAQAAANNATDQKLTNYSTTLQMNSAIKQSADNIMLTVSKTYTTGEQVQSIIEQNAESIRLQANKISWKSTNSEMTEDGHLTATGATINGTFRSTNGTEWLMMSESRIFGGSQAGRTDGTLDLSANNGNTVYGVLNTYGNALYLHGYSINIGSNNYAGMGIAAQVNAYASERIFLKTPKVAQIFADGNIDLSSGATLTLYSSAAAVLWGVNSVTVQATGGAVTMIGKTGVTLSSDTGKITVTGKGGITLASDSDITIQGARVYAEGHRPVWSDGRHTYLMMWDDTKLWVQIDGVKWVNIG